MSDTMQKDEVCEGCLFHPFLFGEEPCRDCSRAFSGRQKDWYKKVGSPLTRKESVEPSVLSPAPVDTEEEYLAKLIDDHWGYIEGLLESHGVSPEEMYVSEFHYRTAAAHFWKHAMEYVKEKA